MVSSKMSQPPHTYVGAFPPPRTYVGAFPGRIYIGAVPKGTTKEMFQNHFRSKKHGEIKEFFISGAGNQVWGFGIITYADPSVADKMIREIQIINGQKVEVTRTMEESNDFKNNKSMVNAFIKYREMRRTLKKKKDQAVSMEVCQEKSEQLKKLYESFAAGETNPQTKTPSAALSPEDLTHTEWYYLVCMPFVFNIDQG